MFFVKLKYLVLLVVYFILLKLRGKSDIPPSAYIGNDVVLINRLWKLKFSPCYNSSAKIALYGAGTHTHRLLKTKKLDASKICAIFDDAPKKTECCGLPVYPVAKVSEIDFDMLVVSSDAYEKEMFHKAETWLPEGKILVALYSFTIKKIK